MSSAEGIEMGILPQLLGFQLRKAQVRVFNAFMKSLGDADITPSDFGLLVVVGANPRLNQNALARAIGSNRSLLVAMINKLEARGLVARLPSEKDKRSHAVVLSRRGDVLVKRLKGIVQDHDVGWYNLSAQPGQGDNIVLWGHVLRFSQTPKIPAPFARLKEVKPGATVVDELLA